MQTQVTMAARGRTRIAQTTSDGDAKVRVWTYLPYTSVPYAAAATTSSATSVGVVPTLMPTASSASFFAGAVPDEPEMMAPAWPIVLPGGAEKPAMYENTGVDMCSLTQRAAFSSSSPPISPTSTTYFVSGSASNFSSTSMKPDPTTGSPPMPTIVELPSPRCASSLPIWYVSVPERETSPIEPGRKTSAGMIPTFALPGERTPGQLGPTSVTPFGRMYV